MKKRLVALKNANIHNSERRDIIMDKKGKTSPFVWVVVMVALGLVAYFGFFQSTGGINLNVGDRSCDDNAPYIDNSTFNEYAKGTGVAVTYSYALVGSSDPVRTLTPGSSGTDFHIGDKLKILTSASGYIDRVDEYTITQCGANKFTNFILGTDGGTIDILDQNLNAVTDSAVAVTGGQVNLSDGGSANPLNAVLRIDGVVDKTTGQLLITIEANDSEVDAITLSAKSSGANIIDSEYPTGDLDLFTSEGTSPVIKRAFVVDEVLDGGQVDYNVKFTPESGVTMGSNKESGFVFVNAYEGQWFVDTDGTIAFGWEDADGTAKHEGAFADHDALIS